MEGKPTKDEETSEVESTPNTHRELAIEATELFERGEFSESLSRLAKLQEQRPLDTRFTHNAAVVEFYANNFKNVDDFKRKLDSVCSLGEINFDNIDSLDDVRNCCIYYNQAVLLYHNMQYSSAFRILNKVFSFVETMDDELRRSVTLLFLELLLRAQKPDRALSVIAAIENLLRSDLTNKSESNITDDKSSREEPSSREESSNSDVEAFKLRLKVYQCRCFLAMRNPKSCERELENFVRNSEKILVRKDYFSEKLHEARCTNVRYCAKFLQSYLAYLKGSLKLSVQLLSALPVESNFSLTGDSTPLAFYNNMGCLHLYMGKPNLANLYFQKALKENESNRKVANSNNNDTTNKYLFTCDGNKLPQLMYNLGVSLLHSGKPIQAFDCLTLAVQVYHTNPRLWLRLAECCIMVHKNSNDRDFDFINKRKEVLHEVIGNGIHRKLILNLGLFENNKYSYDAQSFAIPVATLEFATLCLRNALMLLSGSFIDCSPSNPVTAAQVMNLRASVLVASAYVSLCLGDPIVAMNSCRNLLNIPNCSGVHKLLGHLYIAESLILLDRLPEALEHLKPDFSNYMLPPEVKENSGLSMKMWKPDNSASARAVFQYNLAVVLTLKGELLKAAELLKQVWLTKGPQCEIPVQIISLALYIELSLGRADIARNIIKQNCPQYSRPSS